MVQNLRNIKANVISNITEGISATMNVGGNLNPTANVTYNLGNTTHRWKDLFLSNSTIYLGNTTFNETNVFPFNLVIAPEVLTIDVAAPAAGDDTAWLWNWQTSTLPYARTTVVNSQQVNVPLYKQGTYQINNFANQQTGVMTQRHSAHLKWIDGAGLDNLVSWANEVGNVSFSNPNINSGTTTTVQRINVTVPSNITLPTLVAPNIANYMTVSCVNSGVYTFSGNGDGDNRTLGPLYRGGTYTFHLDSSLSTDPFYFTTDNGTNFTVDGYHGEYTTGVTGSRNDGTTNKTTITIVVDSNAPDVLFYQSSKTSTKRGAIVIKNLAVETNVNGNYILYFQHTGEGHKTPVEIRPIPSMVNQMCVVYDATVNKFVPQDLATYVENTPSFKNKIREVAGTATLIAPNGVAVVPTVLVVEDTSYLPLINNKEGDIAFDSYYDTIYVWQGGAWRNTKPTSFPGANITGAVANSTYSTNAGTAYSVSGSNVSGQVNFAAIANNIAGSNVSGQVGNALVSGTVYTNAQPNITSVGTLTSLSVTGNISSGNANLGNLTTSNYFTGNGSLLTSITGANVSGQVGNSLVSGTVYSSSQPNITSVGTLTGLTVSGNTSITGNLTVSGTTVTVGSTNVAYVDSIIELHTQANLAPLTTDDGKDVGIRVHYFKSSDKHAFFGFANDTQAFEYYVDGTETSGVFSGTYGNFKGATYISTVSTGTAPITVSSTTKVANLNADLLDGYDTATANTANTVAVRDTSGNISANYFTGNGSSLTSITGANVTGQVGNSLIAGTVYTAAQPNITSVGSLTSLTSGTHTLNANANIAMSGTLSQISGANLISGTYLTGTLTTAAQPNITSVGTLTNTTLGSSNSLTGGNLVSASYLTGTLTTAAQPNITSLGTLSSLSVTGNVSAGNIKTDNLLYANGTAWSFGSGSGLKYTAGTTPPATGNIAGDQWFDTSANVLFEYLNDGTSNYWVDTTSSSISSTGTSGGTSNARAVGYSLVFGG